MCLCVCVLSHPKVLVRQTNREANTKITTKQLRTTTIFIGTHRLPRKGVYMKRCVCVCFHTSKTYGRELHSNDLYVRCDREYVSTERIII